MFITQKNNKNFVPGLKETDAYPAEPEDGYGWENYLARECRHFTEDFGLANLVKISQCLWTTWYL